MLRDLKPVLFILLRFLGVYLLFLFFYQIYLNNSEVHGLDGFSQWVADQVCSVQQWMGYQSSLYHDAKNLTTYFWVKDDYVSRMVEGCNAISVMILFAAFVFAFFKGLKTVWFIIAGVILLHLMNLTRIALLNIVLADYPKYGKIAHDYFFPAVIYGTVVVLWLVWIKVFALKK